VRRSAVEALGRIGDPQATSPLAQMLDDESALVRRSAARALGLAGESSAVPALRQALADKDAQVRWQAAWALGEVGDERDLPFLAELLNDNEGGTFHKPVREAAQRSIDRIKRPHWAILGRR
jgi:bilin biosynthesis protein